MISTEGTIQSVHADHVVFKYQQESTCNSYKLKAGCGQEIMSKWWQSVDTIAISSDHPALHGFEAGDAATLEIADNTLAISALISYLLPIISLMAGGMLMSLFSSMEWLIIIGSVLGLLLGGTGVFLYNLYQYNNPWYQPRLADTPTNFQDNFSGEANGQH